MMRAHFLRSSKPSKFLIKIQIKRITTVQKLQVIAKSHHPPLNCSQHCMQCCLPNLRQPAFDYDLACLFSFCVDPSVWGPLYPIKTQLPCGFCVCIVHVSSFVTVFLFFARRRKGRKTRKIATFMDFPRSIRFATLLPHAPLLTTRRFME